MGSQVKRHKMTPAERKAAQRQRDRLSGWVEVTVKVAAERVEEVRAFVSSLPAPPPPTDPAQLELLGELEAALSSGTAADDDEPQGRLL